MASSASAAVDAGSLPSKLDMTSALYFWNRVNKVPKNSVYTLQSGGRLIGTSDFEGVSFSMLNLFEEPEVDNTNIINSQPQSLANLMKEFIVRDKDSKITLANKNDIFYFSGDVWGVGPRNIQLLRELINMKTQNTDATIVIYGNRDLNRGRWTVETDLIVASRLKLIEAMIAFNINPTKGIELLNSVVIDFKYNIPPNSDESYDEDLPFNYLWQWDGSKVNPPLPPVDWGIRIASCHTAKDRVEMISDSMGEKDGWKFIVDEYAFMCGDNFVEALNAIGNDDIKYKIYLHLVYLMSSNEQKLGVNECHQTARDFIDIYLDQMNASNLYAVVNFDATNESALISHGVVSKPELPIEPGTIPETDTEKNEVVSLEDGINGIESGMIGIASDSNPYRWLSIISSLTSVNFDIYYNRGKYNYTGAWHDVTGSFSTIKGGRKHGLLSKDASKLIKSKTIFKSDGVAYRVSGHTPIGYIGLVKKGQNSKYYFCTDVSKTDEQNYNNKNRNTCCFLILEPDETNTPKMKSRFIGRFAIAPTDIKSSNLVDGQIDSSKPLYVNYSLVVDLSTPEKPYLSLPELKYGERFLKFSYTLYGPTKIKNVTLYDVNAARLEEDKNASLGIQKPESLLSSGIARIIGRGGTRRRNYKTSTKKSKKMKITKNRHYKNKRTSQKKHKKSRK